MRHEFNRSLLAALSCGAMLVARASFGAAAAQPTKLTISYSQKNVDNVPLLMARDAGYFKKHNLDVTVRYLRAQEGIPALIAGQVQAADIGGTDAASAEVQGVKLKLVLTLMPVYPHQFWVWRKYASPDKLKGQRVGITSTTGSGYASTVLALKALGLKPSDVSITPMGSISNLNSALLAGSIAATISHPPASYKFKQAGLVDLVDLTKKHLPSVTTGLWFSDTFVKAHPEVVQGVVDAMLRALNREKADRTFAESEIAKYLKVTDKAELDFTYDFYIKEALTPGPMPQVAELQANINALAASNPKLKTVNATDMIDQNFVKNAERHGSMK